MLYRPGDGIRISPRKRVKAWPGGDVMPLPDCFFLANPSRDPGIVTEPRPTLKTPSGSAPKFSYFSRHTLTLFEIRQLRHQALPKFPLRGQTPAMVALTSLGKPETTSSDEVFKTRSSARRVSFIRETVGVHHTHMNNIDRLFKKSKRRKYQRGFFYFATVSPQDWTVYKTN